MFDVKKHLIKVQGGRQYLPVAARLIWFRSEHPDWGIDTRAIAIDVEKQYAVFESSVYNAEGKLMAKGTKMENIRGFGDWLEKAETGAIGRALAVCGFGTQFAPDLEEGHDSNSDGLRPSNGYQGDRGYYGGRNSRSEPNGGHQSYQNTAAGHAQTGASGPEKLSVVGHDTEDSSSITTSDAGGSNPLLQGEMCDTCSAVLKPSQLSLSLRKFGAALCPDCQRKRKSEQAA